MTKVQFHFLNFHNFIFFLITFISVITSNPHTLLAQTSEQDGYYREEYYKAGSLTETSNKMIISINCSKVENISDIHQVVQSALHLPSSYGKNLDALFDVLTDKSIIHKRTEISLEMAGYLSVSLGQKQADELLEVLNSAQEKNDLITIFYWQ